MKTYVLHITSPAYGGEEMECVINARNKGECWKKIIDVIGSKWFPMYQLFSVAPPKDSIILKAKEEGVEFILDKNNIRLNESFDKFVDEHDIIKGNKYIWSYKKFANLIDELQRYFVTDNITDDDFVSFEWRLNDISGNGEYVTWSVIPEEQNHDYYVSLTDESVVGETDSDVYKFSTKIDDLGYNKWCAKMIACS